MRRVFVSLLACVALNARSLTSVTARTLVVVVELLLAATGSVSVPLTVAVVLIVPGAEKPNVTCTTTCTVAVASTASEPRLQVIVDVPAHEPWLEETEMKLNAALSVSLTVTPVAMAGPLFTTLMT